MSEPTIVVQDGDSMGQPTILVVQQEESEILVLARDPAIYITGPIGPSGPPGPPLLIKGNLNSVADLPNNPTAGDGYLIQGILYTWTGTEWINGGQIQGPQGLKGDTGPQGIPGNPGPANILSIGTVTTGTAAATITGTSPEQTLNLTIPQGPQGIQGPQGMIGEQSWTINLGPLRDSSSILEGSSFPKSFTFSPLGKSSTLLRVIGLVSLIGGSAIITLQKGSIGSFTNIGGLTNLGINQIPVDFLASGANNSLQAGERLRLLFTSISGVINLSFTIIYTEP